MPTSTDGGGRIMDDKYELHLVFKSVEDRDLFIKLTKHLIPGARVEEE